MENENERKMILLVDDNKINLTAGKEILRDKYKTYPIPSAEIMFDLLENITPDMILLDVEMPEMNGYQAIKILKANPKWSDIPVMFLTAKTDEGSELEGLGLGAVDYVFKPFSAPLLLKRIENHLFSESQKKQLREINNNLEKIVREKTAKLIAMQSAVLNTVADLVEFRDDTTGGHIFRTQKYMELLLNKLIEEGIYKEEISRWNLDFLLPSAQLHDVGKIGISDLILNKPGKLTDDEFNIMKTHVSIGVKAIEHIEEVTEGHEFLKHARLIAGGHHEKWDGTGYPKGLAGTAIPLEGRLMAIVDVFDALVSSRPYKQPLSAEEARKIIEKSRGTHFDPLLVDIFSRTVEQFADILGKSLKK